MKESNRKISHLLMVGLIGISLLIPVVLASSNIVNTTLGTQITVNAKRVRHHRRGHSHKHVRHHIHKHTRHKRHKHVYRHKRSKHGRKRVRHHRSRH